MFDAAKQLNEVQGLKGLGRYFKQIAQSARSGGKDSIDDFLGAVDIALNVSFKTSISTAAAAAAAVATTTIIIAKTAAASATVTTTTAKQQHVRQQQQQPH